MDQYTGLPRIDRVIKNQTSHSLLDQSSNKARSIPRAKKSTSQSWLDSLDSKPELVDLYILIVNINSSPRPLEVDTICLPFPQILDNPFLSSTGNPCISISSFLSNYEDSYRWIKYENSISLDDI